MSTVFRRHLLGSPSLTPERVLTGARRLEGPPAPGSTAPDVDWSAIGTQLGGALATGLANTLNPKTDSEAPPPPPPPPPAPWHQRTLVTVGGKRITNAAGIGAGIVGLVLIVAIARKK